MKKGKPSPRVKLVQETKSRTQGISRAARVCLIIDVAYKDDEDLSR